MFDFEENISLLPQKVDLGVEFTTKWVVWMQVSKMKYKPIYRFHTIMGFWFIVNKLTFVRTIKMIFMRDGLTPNWDDDPHHQNGGYTIITIPESFIRTHVLCSNFLLGVVGESLVSSDYNSLNITGITICLTNNIREIRFWLSNYAEPLFIKYINPKFLTTLDNKRIDASLFQHKSFSSLA